MDEVDIEAISTGTFIFSQNMSGWAQVYPLAQSVFRSYMRANDNDPVVWYSWASDGLSPGKITFSETAANGTITFAQNPSPGDTLQLGATLVTFVASGPSGNQVLIGTTLVATLNNLLAFLVASLDSQIVLCSYSLSQYTLSIIYKTTAVAGNNFVIASSTENAALSAGTLAGGGGMVQMTAPIGDLSSFNGDYVYDFRLEYAGAIVYLFGGTISFTQGVTR